MRNLEDIQKAITAGYPPDSANGPLADIEDKSGTTVIEFSGAFWKNRDSLYKRLTEIAGTEDWFFFARVGWRGTREKSLETNYWDDYTIESARLEDLWLEVDEDDDGKSYLPKKKITVPHNIWTEVDDGSIEEILRDHYTDGNMSRKIDASDLKVAKELVSIFKGLTASDSEYVMFYDNAGKNRKLPVEFTSEREADKFIEQYQNAGGYKQFEYDIFGDDRGQFIEYYKIRDVDIIRHSGDYLMHCLMNKFE